MASSDVQQKLTAVFCTDVVGYSRLMADDPEATLRTLTACREVFSTHIRQNKGRIVNAPGDSILAEFGSLSDAVRCAMEVQEELGGRNEALPEQRRMHFRIGLTLGDVLIREGELFGDGVNAAARLESLAEPGGVCISRTAYDQVKQRLDYDYEYIGEHTGKNLAEPLRAYRVRPKLEAPPSGGRGPQPLAETTQPLELPEKPSVAVLAFENMSGDPEQGYFGDGLAEDIITDLAKISGLFVIARNASFAYKGKAANPQQVGRELGVRHVLEGSVRKAANRVRITGQLIDTRTGDHVWAERYDRDLDDVFAVQDEITSEIVTVLDIRLAHGERARILRQSLKNPEARDCYYQARQLFWAHPSGEVEAARRLFDRVIELEPDSPVGYVGKASTFVQEARQAWSEARQQTTELAGELVRKALELDESHPGAHALLAFVQLHNREHEQALAEAERAEALSPNDPDTLVLCALVRLYSGNAEGAIADVKKAMRLCPICPPSYFTILGVANRTAGQYEEAVVAAEEGVRRNPTNATAYFVLLTSMCALERYEEARRVANQLRDVNPKFSLTAWAEALPYRDRSYVDKILGDLEKAGLA
jgi:adenylate cyclase